MLIDCLFCSIPFCSLLCACRHALLQPIITSSTNKAKKQKRSHSDSKKSTNSKTKTKGTSAGEAGGEEEALMSVNIKDLKSTNGTKINGVSIPPNRYSTVLQHMTVQYST